MGFGDYPVDYNPKIHGPYDPSRFYGKPDTPFGQVKLGELGAWIGRRNKTPSSVSGAISRAFWRWNLKYVQPRRNGVAPFFQITTACMILFYMMNSKRIGAHKNYKYH